MQFTRTEVCYKFHLVNSKTQHIFTFRRPKYTLKTKATISKFKFQLIYKVKDLILHNILRTCNVRQLSSLGKRRPWRINGTLDELKQLLIQGQYSSSTHHQYHHQLLWHLSLMQLLDNRNISNDIRLVKRLESSSHLLALHHCCSKVKKYSSISY